MATKKKIVEPVDETLESLKASPVITPIAVPVTKGDPLVKVRPNKTFKMQVGRKVWEFVQGEIALVPESVKVMLNERGDLGAV